jgi:hypothetical protein
MTYDKQKFADPQVVFKVPASPLEKVDEIAQRELISRAGVRRLVARAVRANSSVCQGTAVREGIS